MNRNIGQRVAKKTRRTMLGILSALMVIVVIVIAAEAHFSTNVYKDKEGFKEYADAQFHSNTLLEMATKTDKVYEYGTPVSYASECDATDNEMVEEFRQERIDEFVEDYRERQAAEEAQRAQENKDDKNYEAPAEALILNSNVCETGNGAVSIAVGARENREQDNDMVQVGESIETYFISSGTGRALYPEQVLSSDYRTRCAEYFTDYFKENYDSDELAEGWENSVADSAANFNTLIISKKNITFFFEAGTVLSESEGMTVVKVSKTELGDIMRDKVTDRYIDPDKPMVALTYDDGPGDDSESRILDCLEQNGAVATFFYTGSRVSKRGDKIERAKTIGCEIGNHTWNHSQLTGLTTEEVKEQITKTNEAIKAACGSYPTLFRPSYGATNDAINSAAGMPVIMWSIDTLDWKTKDAQATFNCIAEKARQGKLDGRIILMHSIHDSTADATELILPWLRENGYQTVTVSELLKYRREGEITNSKVYY